MSFVLQLVKAYWPTFPENETPGKRQNTSQLLFMDLLELEAPNLMQAPDWRQVWLAETTIPANLVSDWQLDTVLEAVRTTLGVAIHAERRTGKPAQSHPEVPKNYFPER